MGNAFLNSESSHFSDIQAFNLILLGILYLTVRILSGLSQYIQLTVVLGLLFYFLGEAIAGFGQIHDFVAPRHLIAQMSGSFQNSESYDVCSRYLFPWLSGRTMLRVKGISLYLCYRDSVHFWCSL